MFFLPGVECVNTIQEFDTITKTITTLSTILKNKAAYITAVAVGRDIYLFGGCDNVDGTVNCFDTIQKFDTITKTITTLLIVLNKPAAAVIAGLIGEKIYILGGGTAPKKKCFLNF